MKIEIVSKNAALCNLGIWQDKGYGPLTAVRGFEQPDSTILVGFASYSDPEVLEVPGHMYCSEYENYEEALAAVGEMIDCLERGEYLEEIRAQIEADKAKK